MSFVGYVKGNGLNTAKKLEATITAISMMNWRQKVIQV